MNRWYDLFNEQIVENFINNKPSRIRDEIVYMSSRLATMFDWNGLPDTIPPYILERLLQWHGNACIFKHADNLYATFGGLGGEPDYNYEPTLYTIANPALNYSAELLIGKECVRMRNDSFGWGLLPLHTKYATLICENNITIRVATIAHRIDRGIVADNDRAYESAQDFLSSIEDGELAPMMSEEFFEGIHGLECGTNTENITDVIECLQYLKASWFNEIGLNSNYNMKRERIAAPEAQMSDDALLPLVDEMLERRRIGCEEVNNLFGTEWSVDLAGAWLKEHLKQQVPGADFDSDGDAQVDEMEDMTGDDSEDNESIARDIIDDDGDSADDDGDNTTDEPADDSTVDDNSTTVIININSGDDDTEVNTDLKEGEEDEDETETVN